MLASRVELSVTIAAPPAAVWRVIVDPELAPRWLGGFHLSSSWEVGSPFAISGQLNGKHYRESGAVLAFEPPRRLRYSHWSELWRVPDAPENRAVMTFRLEPDGDGTRVSLRHELPAVEALAQHSAFFWRGGLQRLKGLVEG